jgi:hypothetical protein
VQLGRFQMSFMRNVIPPSSGLRNKPNKKRGITFTEMQIYDL